MAGKTTTKKTKSVVATEEVVVKAEPEKVVETKKVPRKFAPDDRIECRSVTGGELILIGQKSQLQYT